MKLQYWMDYVSTFLCTSPLAQIRTVRHNITARYVHLVLARKIGVVGHKCFLLQMLSGLFYAQN